MKLILGYFWYFRFIFLPFHSCNILFQDPGTLLATLPRLARKSRNTAKSHKLLIWRMIPKARSKNRKSNVTKSKFPYNVEIMARAAHRYQKQYRKRGEWLGKWNGTPIKEKALFKQYWKVRKMESLENDIWCPSCPI
jgi:hypothetical protein